jgi:hypothetical protein
LFNGASLASGVAGVTVRAIEALIAIVVLLNTTEHGRVMPELTEYTGSRCAWLAR